MFVTVVRPKMNSKIVLCCDGTWCGKATGTYDSNVKILANTIAEHNLVDGQAHPRPDGHATVCYFEGVGVDGTFEDYLVNGAIAEDIRAKCIEAYKFLVEEFVPGKKIWMIGFSRGAYTVRCVAGMINNFGIVNNEGVTDQTLNDLCNTVYLMYRSRDPLYAPKGASALEFRQAYSYGYDYPPIEFMGLFDTVGSLGIPKIDPEVSLSYDFYDQNVSSEVEHVFQGIVTHDRLFAFEPCFARRSPDSHAAQPVEVWFPGAHYDIGRVQFVPLRRGISLEGALRFFQERTNIAGLNIDFTEEYSRDAFEWMAKRIQSIDDGMFNVDPAVAYNAYVIPHHLLLFNPLTKNAYDELYNRIKLIPFVDSIFGKQVIRDRHIPIYNESSFYSSNNLPRQNEYLSGTSGNVSRAFDVRESIEFSPIGWTQ